MIESFLESRGWTTVRDTTHSECSTPYEDYYYKGKYTMFIDFYDRWVILVYIKTSTENRRILEEDMLDGDQREPQLLRILEEIEEL